MSSSKTDLSMANADESLLQESSSSSLWVDVDKRESSPPVGIGEDLASGESASQRVVLNHDILPLVFKNLTDLNGSNAATWRKAFTALLFVNKSFFQCAADMLWDTMDSLEPAFKLLPWFEARYSGIGAHNYSGSGDWDRFVLYSSRIRCFSLQSTSNLDISPVWFMELFTLPGRPDPLFPMLQNAILSSTSLSGPPITFFLVGPALRSLHINDSLSPSSANALSILPRLSVSSPNFQSFNFWGKLGKELLLQLSKVTSITSMELTSLSSGDRRHLRSLRQMPFLKSLLLSVPLFTPMSNPLMKEPLTNHGRLLALTSLDVTATEYQQCLIARAISPQNLDKLTLTFRSSTDVMALYLCLALYINANPYLSQLVLIFNNWPSSHNFPTIPPESRAEWPTTEAATDGFIPALRTLKDVEWLTIHRIPLNLAVLISQKLIHGISYWSRLTRLFFIAAFDDQTRSFSTPPFPGLSFLASKVWKHCPNLEELEYHFDRGLVQEEDLTESLAACETQLGCTAAAGGEYPTGHHRLRKLCINTGNYATESKQLDLPVSRRMQITTFLDRLFPALEVVEGSASEVWKEIDALVRSCQDQRVHFIAQVDAVLAAF